MAIVLDFGGVKARIDMTKDAWEKLSQAQQDEIIEEARRGATGRNSDGTAPSSGMTAAFVDGFTNQLPAQIGQGLEWLGGRIGTDTVRDYGRDLGARNRMESGREYTPDPSTSRGIIESFRDGGIGAGLNTLGTRVAEGAGTALPGVAATGLALAGAPLLGAGAGLATLGATGAAVVQGIGGMRDQRVAQGLDPNINDIDALVGAGTSALSGLRLGRGLALGAGRLGRAGVMVGREAGENAVQEAAQAGTVAAQGGSASVGDIASQALEAGIVGGVTGGLYHGAQGSVRAAGRGITGTSDRFKVAADPEVRQADRRMLSVGQKLQEETGSSFYEAMNTVVRNDRVDLENVATNLRKLDYIDPTNYKVLREAIEAASRHTSNANAGEGEGTNFVERVRSMPGIPEDVRTTLIQGLHDLNVASANRTDSKAVGAAERVLGLVGSATGYAGAGYAMGGNMGALAGGGLSLMARGSRWAGGNLGGSIGAGLGRKVDTFLGTRSASLDRRARAIMRNARMPGGDDGTGYADVRTMADSLRIEAAERRGRGAQEIARQKAAREAELKAQAEAKAKAKAINELEKAGGWLERTLLKKARAGLGTSGPATGLDRITARAQRQQAIKQANAAADILERAGAAVERAEIRNARKDRDMLGGGPKVPLGIDAIRARSQKDAPVGPQEPAGAPPGPSPLPQVPTEPQGASTASPAAFSGIPIEDPAVQRSPEAMARARMLARPPVDDPIRNQTAYNRVSRLADARLTMVQGLADNLRTTNEDLASNIFRVAGDIRRNKSLSGKLEAAEALIEQIDAANIPRSDKDRLISAIRDLSETGGSKQNN